MWYDGKQVATEVHGPQTSEQMLPQTASGSPTHIYRRFAKQGYLGKVLISQLKAALQRCQAPWTPGEDSEIHECERHLEVMQTEVPLSPLYTRLLDYFQEA